MTGSLDRERGERDRWVLPHPFFFFCKETRAMSSRGSARMRAPEGSAVGTVKKDSTGVVMILSVMLRGAIMSDETGAFRVDIEIENPARAGQRRALQSVLVDTGAELSWVPAAVLESLGVERNNKWQFRQADGTI